MKQSEIYRLAQTFLAPCGPGAEGICNAITKACHHARQPLLPERTQLHWRRMFNDRVSSYWWRDFSPASQQERFMVLELMALMTEGEE